MSPVAASAFKDHFSPVAAGYARARPGYPDALFDWIAGIAPGRALAWEPGCGSGQASAGLAARFDRVHASDPSAAQIAQARGAGNVDFAIGPAERCALADASVDAVCVAQALHWFDLPAFFAECARVLRPGGVLVAWGYQDLVVPPALAAANAALQADVAPYWPPERALIDEAYAQVGWPFPVLPAPSFALQADWPLSRLLDYYASYSASQRYRDATGGDVVAAHAGALAAAWGDPEQPQRMAWPLFVHACRRPG